MTHVNKKYEKSLAVLDATIAKNVFLPARPSKGMVLTSGSDLRPEPIQWLWLNWLALGKLHLLAGAPGQGKTTIAMDLAATVTVGGHWPDGSRCEAGNVLIWSGEDDPADTLLPRILAAGGDRSKVFFVSGVRVGGDVMPFDPARHMTDLLTAVSSLGGVKLIIVDPIVSAVTGDSHKNTEVRRALQPLVDVAASCQCALLGITHFSKGGQGTDPTQRVVGSVGFTAVARVVLVAAKVRSMDGRDTRILARSKSNIGPDGGGFQYYLDQVTVEAFPGIEAARIAWGEAVEGNASQLLTDPNEGKENFDEDEKSSALEAAVDFIKQLLKVGPSLAKYVREQSTEAGIAWATVRRASTVLKVKKHNKNGAWYWSLPGTFDMLNQLAHVAQGIEVEQVEQVEQVAGRIKYLDSMEPMATGIL